LLASVVTDDRAVVVAVAVDMMRERLSFTSTLMLVAG
jgi:hypothetical protein